MLHSCIRPDINCIIAFLKILFFSDYAGYSDQRTDQNGFNYVRANSPSLFLAPSRPNPSPTYPPQNFRPRPPPPPADTSTQVVQSLPTTSGYASNFQVKSFLTEDELKNKYYQYWADQQVSQIIFCCRLSCPCEVMIYRLSKLGTTVKLSYNEQLGTNHFCSF